MEIVLIYSYNPIEIILLIIMMIAAVVVAVIIRNYQHLKFRILPFLMRGKTCGCVATF